ncbi:MAG: drug/metabolite transporter (DMT)-like permease [Gammaproteobacteria bacterium]|jgi:drug/metabolite transporter (DMT)-like permease
MLLSMLLFSLMDTSVKWLGGQYPTAQIMFFRCGVALVPVLIILYMRGGFHILKTKRPGWHLLRSIIGTAAMGFAFYAISIMKLADAVSLLHSAPIFMILLSIIFLKEKVGIRRWSAIILGFTGALLIARPGNGILENGAFYMLIAAFCIACTTLIIRFLGKFDDPVCITFYFTVAGILISSIAIYFTGWVTPSLPDLVILCSIGLLGGTAQYLMTLGYRYAEIATLAPLKYLSILFSGLFAYWIWQELPDLQSLFGISLIVCTSLYTLHRELIVNRNPVLKVG